MSGFRQPRRKLAGLIQSHYGRDEQPTRAADEPLAHFDLEGWRVLEVLSVGSDEYLLLRRSQDLGDAPSLAGLAVREREAVRRACAGASNKEIAYQMGVSASTIRVLLWRASKKIGVKGRLELVRRLTRSSP
jgi:DNA-binding CsgD family transcriptional regulator